MDEARKHEIGYRLLLQRLRSEGLLFNTRFKHQLDEASATLGIPEEEMRDFGVLIAQDCLTKSAITEV